MSKRINIVLPEATVRTIDRMVKPSQRSRFINQTVQHFVANRSIEALRTQLEQTAVRDRDLDRVPDAGGLAYHVARLNAGVSRGEVLVGFSESPENQANVIGQIADGMLYVPYA